MNEPSDICCSFIHKKTGVRRFIHVREMVQSPYDLNECCEERRVDTGCTDENVYFVNVKYSNVEVCACDFLVRDRSCSICDASDKGKSVMEKDENSRHS